MPEQETRVLCQTPTPGKEGTRIPRWKYDAMRAAILKAVTTSKDGIEFQALPARESILMKARDGTVVEVFEWVSQEAIDSAHTNPKVLEMWQEFSEACDYVPLNQLAETAQIFAQFKNL